MAYGRSATQTDVTRDTISAVRDLFKVIQALQRLRSGPRQLLIMPRTHDWRPFIPCDGGTGMKQSSSPPIVS